MTIWYVQPVAPVLDPRPTLPSLWGDQLSGGDGSEGSPYGSLQELIDAAVLGNGDQVRLDQETNGIPNYGPVEFIGVSNLFVTRKAGLLEDQRSVNGYPIDSSIYTLINSSGTYDVYKIGTTGDFPVVAGVSQDWNTSINARGERYGILVPQAGLTELREAFGYYHNEGTDSVYVAVLKGTLPSDYNYIIGQDGNVIEATNCPNFVITRIRGEHALNTTSNDTYGIRVDELSPGAIIMFCSGDGCAKHTIGSVADNPSGTRIKYCTALTGMPGNDGHFILFAGAAGGSITDCEISYNVAHLVPWLGIDGNAIETVGGVSGFGCHTDPASDDTPAGGLIFHHNETKYFGHNPTAYSPSLAFVAADSNHGGRPADIFDPSTFSIRMYDNIWHGMGMSVGGGTQSNTWVVSERDSWNIDAPLYTGATGTGGFLSCSNGADGLRAVGSDCGLVLISCVISAEMDKTVERGVVSPWGSSGGASEVHLRNNSIHLRGTGYHSSTAMVKFASNCNGFSAEKNVLSCEQASGIRMSLGSWSGAMADSAAEIAGWNNNWYDPKFSNSFNASEAGATRAGFQSTIDPDGEFVAVTGFVSDLTLEPDAVGIALAISPMGSGFNGINARAYDGHYGAYQYGGALPGGGRKRSSVRNRGTMLRSRQ